MTRLFFGIELSSEVRDALTSQVKRLQMDGVQAGNWSRPELYHITAVFLGDLSEAWLEKLRRVARAAVAEVPAFQLALGNLGMFPKNRILFAQLQEGTGTTQLAELVHALNRELAAICFSDLDTRPYRPHITLARKLNVPSIYSEDVKGQPIVGLTPLPAIQFTVDGLCLFASTRVDGRLSYPVMERFAFSPHNT